MPVLDTFYILFKSDSEDVEKGAKGAKGSVDKLEKSISGADKTSVSLGKKFNALATTAVAAFASVFAVTKLISGAQGIADQSSELGVLSDVLGESSAEITNWGRAVQNMGGDSKAFQGSMRSLSGSLNDALINGPNGATDALAKMGVSARDANGNMKTVLQILPDLAREFSGLTRESALARGKSLGLDEGTILLLMEGEQAVASLVARQREMNTVSDDEIEKLRRLKAGTVEFGNAVKDLGTNALTGLISGFEALGPAFDSAKEDISSAAERWEFFGDAMDLVTTGIDGLESKFDSVLTLIATNLENITDIFSGFDIGGFFDDVDEGYKELKDFILPGIGEVLGSLSFADLSPNLSGIIDRIQGMGDTPLTAVGAGGNGAVSSSRSASVTVGEVNIETQATDAAGIAADISAELENQLSNAVEQSDDGIAA